MYKIIITFATRENSSPITKVYTYFDLDACRRELANLKDRYISMGCIISELAIYKVKQIEDVNQI